MTRARWYIVGFGNSYFNGTVHFGRQTVTVNLVSRIGRTCFCDSNISHSFEIRRLFGQSYLRIVILTHN